MKESCKSAHKDISHYLSSFCFFHWKEEKQSNVREILTEKDESHSLICWIMVKCAKVLDRDKLLLYNKLEI